MANTLILPKHTAFIMDGNGRWAQSKNKARTSGHLEGANRIKEIIQFSVNLKLEVVSFFAFGIENWKRPLKEVKYIWNLVKRMLTKKVIKWLLENNVKFNWIGFKNELIPKEILSILYEVQDKTKNNSGTVVNLFMNYSGQADILNAVQKIQKINNVQVDESVFEKNLLTGLMAPVDLLIRTSGEQRISNFMLWQIAYSEIIFLQTYWPDFNKNEFEKCLEIFQKRERRFGGLAK